MAENKQITAPASKWVHPDEMVKIFMKKNKLNARMAKKKKEENPAPIVKSGQVVESQATKRKNPFLKAGKENSSKVAKCLEIDAINEDTTMSELMNPKSNEKNAKLPLSFTSVLAKINDHKEPFESVQPALPKGEKWVPVDWTLNKRLKIMSEVPFPWNTKFKASEEASGTTGFVRCLDIGEEDTTLDTSLNARFHQCCLVWQHPFIPFLDLFPRTAGRSSGTTPLMNKQLTRDAMYQVWCNSFRSLFHLLRTRQCPYFYLCTNSYTVIFRAAGICGLSEMHALVTPTTRGFRQALKQEEIDFSMPLRERKRRSGGTDSDFDDTMESSMSVNLLQSESVDHLDEDEEDEDETGEDFYQSWGFDDTLIKSINNTSKKISTAKESEVDNLKQSMIFVTGVEVQGLFNFLLNCKTTIAGTGPLAGVPPTLLSPVAFHYATLVPIKTKESVVYAPSDDSKENKKFYSLQLLGPLLPNVIPSLCKLMNSSQLNKYSIACAPLQSTTSFSLSKQSLGQNEAEQAQTEKRPQNVFGRENLTDCGFDEELLAHFCTADSSRIKNFDSLKFCDGLFSWK